MSSQFRSSLMAYEDQLLDAHLEPEPEPPMRWCDYCEDETSADADNGEICESCCNPFEPDPTDVGLSKEVTAELEPQRW